MQMFMSDTTLESLSSDEDPRGWVKVLRSKKPTLARCTALSDIVLFDLAHTGAEAGAWLENAHEAIGCKPS